jgi:hypothetical protein
MYTTQRYIHTLHVYTYTENTKYRHIYIQTALNTLHTHTHTNTQKALISEWLVKRQTSPRTGLRLPDKRLVPNNTLREIIDTFMRAMLAESSRAEEED